MWRGVGCCQRCLCSRAMALRAQGNRVSLYVCGVTVYDYSHIGHARVYVAFDTLFRLLRSALPQFPCGGKHCQRAGELSQKASAAPRRGRKAGYEVTYCRNFTDIDDKIIRRAQEAGVTCSDITNRFIPAFSEDMAALGCLPPTHEPRATEHVADIVTMIEAIIANGHAYAVEGDVFFEVDTLPGYGRLSGRDAEDNRAGERVAVDSRKRNPADFALWKSAKPGEPTWPSPWGPGRPGWHIECSAMIRAILGDSIDIHGGGADLKFPHHENELAQSAAACGCGAHTRDAADAAAGAFVGTWMHNGFVRVDDEKMSKSLGNFFTIRDVLARYAPSALRLMLLGTHYRAAINYSDRVLEEASDRAFYTYQALADADAAATEAAAKGTGGGAPSGVAAEAATAAVALPAAVAEALADDLGTPAALAALSAPLKLLNDLIGTKKGRSAPGRAAALTSLSAAVRGALEDLGLGDGGDPHAALAPLRAAALARAGLTEAALQEAVAARAAARAAGDYAASDAVRDGLAARGIALMDGAAAISWRPVSSSPQQ